MANINIADAEIAYKMMSDPVFFVRSAFGVEPTKQQQALLRSYIKPGSHVSARSGHGTGKTSTLAWIIVHFLLFFDNCRIPCTAPTGHQLFDLLWPEVHKWVAKLPEYLKCGIKITSDRITLHGMEKRRFAVARTARKENPEALQGFHEGNLLFLIDEASGVPDEVFEVAEGALSTRGARVIMTSNPTKLEGYFYRSQTKDRKHWDCHAFDCTESPLVDKKYPIRMRDKHGESSNVYRVRVLGKFPLVSEDILIPLPWVEAAAIRDIDGAGAERVAGLDVARFGDDASALAIRQGHQLIHLESWQGLDTMQTVGKVVALYREGLFDRVMVDVIGVGSGVADRLREMNIPVVDVNVGESSPLNSGKFVALRDELWWQGREWFEGDLCGLSPDLDGEVLEDFMGEVSNVHYQYMSNGKIKIESKSDMKKRGLHSPNLADAFLLTFFEAFVGRQRRRKAVEVVKAGAKRLPGRIGRTLGWT